MESPIRFQTVKNRLGFMKALISFFSGLSSAVGNLHRRLFSVPPLALALTLALATIFNGSAAPLKIGEVDPLVGRGLAVWDRMPPGICAGF